MSNSRYWHRTEMKIITTPTPTQYSATDPRSIHPLCDSNTHTLGLVFRRWWSRHERREKLVVEKRVALCLVITRTNAISNIRTFWHVPRPSRACHSLRFELTDKIVILLRRKPIGLALTSGRHCFVLNPHFIVYCAQFPLAVIDVSGR